jgi:hypothetical protein
VAQRGGTEPRILILSSRRVRRTLFNCALYEFEDSIADFDDATLFSPTRYHGSIRFDVPRHAQRLARLVGRRPSGPRLVPYPTELELGRDYDLLFAVFDNPYDLSLVYTIRNFRERCARVACYVPEVWGPNLEGRRLALEPFAEYDHLFVGTHHDVEAMGRVSGVPSSGLAPAVDTLRFAPWERQLPRVIDIANLGRRVPVTHQALLDLAADRAMFYLYDDILNGDFPGALEHRRWLADVLLRTRYNIANFARCDRPDLNRGTREMGYRFPEGAAAGTVMLGAPPDTPQFSEQLPWEDAVIPLPVEAPDIADVIADLERDPERIEAIRRRNIAGSLRRHDWVYRWCQILETMGLEPTAAAERRRETLLAEAERWDP